MKEMKANLPNYRNERENQRRNSQIKEMKEGPQR
jgi:hypothetical protein